MQKTCKKNANQFEKFKKFAINLQQELLSGISCILILAIKMDLHFCIFCILLLATKMDSHVVCIFLHLDFWGSIFQLHLFCIFSALYLLLCFPERGTARPHNTRAGPGERIAECVGMN